MMGLLFRVDRIQISFWCRQLRPFKWDLVQSNGCISADIHFWRVFRDGEIFLSRYFGRSFANQTFLSIHVNINDIKIFGYILLSSIKRVQGWLVINTKKPLQKISSWYFEWIQFTLFEIQVDILKLMIFQILIRTSNGSKSLF